MLVIFYFVVILPFAFVYSSIKIYHDSYLNIINMFIIVFNKKINPLNFFIIYNKCYLFQVFFRSRFLHNKRFIYIF